MLCGTLVHKYEPLNGSGELYSSPRAQMNTYFSHVAVGCGSRLRPPLRFQIPRILYSYGVPAYA